MSNRNKATHQGHCQACNAIQKLPAGVLAKHGYEVAGYGFFNGVCMGAGHKPLEQDKSIVERSIVWAQNTIADIEKQITDVQAEKGIHFAWFHVYKPATWRYRNSGYKWEYVPVALSCLIYPDGRIWRDGYVYTSEGTASMNQYSINAKSTQELCDTLNAKYVEARRKDIEELQRYIKNQEYRIKTWHTQPLIALEAK